MDDLRREAINAADAYLLNKQCQRSYLRGLTVGTIIMVCLCAYLISTDAAASSIVGNVPTNSEQ